MKTEILAPAGGEQSAYTALLAGADAVYLGLTEFSAREGAENFDAAALARTARFAHLLNAKVYVCLNTLVKDGETERFFACALDAWNAGADAILMQDMFLGRELKRAYPEIVLHLSTQAGCCNLDGALLAKEYGFSRVVLARETPLAEIGRIAVEIETEVFVQGALCTCFSGQCYFSSFAGNHSGNRGRCKQPCRKKYTVDRAGFERAAYALSTSDLCVGTRVRELIGAGVVSLKIEGRLRRGEYVASAVKYYRALLGGGDGVSEFSDLKRAYNRGDYTRGLAFGQEENFLSRNVQGHLGERVGVIASSGGKLFCRSGYRGSAGDGFKILRGGEEIGGAAFAGACKGGFYLSTRARLLAGDEVRLTTDAEGGKRLLTPATARELSVRVRICADEYPVAECEGFRCTGEKPAAAALRAPLGEEEIAACFRKTDGAPFLPRIVAETENAFFAKSDLNAFRRKFYRELAEYLAPSRAPLEEQKIEASVSPVGGKLTAVITADPDGADADVVIYKPRDYRKIEPPARGGEKFLWLPPLLSAEDERLVAAARERFDGFYCDGYYGIALAKKYGKPLFAGAGFNLTNRYAVAGVKRAGAKYFTLSAELSLREQNALAAEGGFALSSGDIKVMELCYCPFSRACGTCDRRDLYTLTDEEGRRFPMRRYRVSGDYRFELFNCSPLQTTRGTASALIDDTTRGGATGCATRGHTDRSML